MAFNFIKKVFSFGRKEVVEEKPAEAEPLPPPGLEALQEPAKEIPSPHSEEGGEAKAAPGEGDTATSPASPSSDPAGYLLPAGEKNTLPLSVAPAPEPREIPQQPEIVPPQPDELPPEEPAVEPSEQPEQPEPAPVEVPEPPEPETPAPQKPQPDEQPAPPPPEVPATAPEAPPSLPDEVPAPAQPAEMPEAPAEEVPSPRRGEGGEAKAEPGEGVPAISSTASLSFDPSGHLLPAGEKTTLPPSGDTAGRQPPKPGKVTVAKKVEQKAEPVAAPQPEPKKSWFQRMREGLSRSSKELSGNIAGVFTRRKLDEDTLQDLEDVLIRADLGVETALRVTDALAASRYGKEVSDADVRAVMAAEVEKVLGPVAMPLELDLSHKPHVVLVVGVNGTGKTTTIGKLAAKLTEGGLSVMLAAGDTFRAAAIEQLTIWGERTGSPVVATKLGADAAGLAYDAFEKAKASGSDVLIIDTAGRLQNKAELMAELEKIVRVLGKLDPEAPHTVLQTVDATTGQNALNQVEIFRNVAGVNGLVMTKLDGTARGGILVAIAAKHKLPVYFIGVGEQIDDLEPFSANDFARAIAGVE